MPSLDLLTYVADELQFQSVLPAKEALVQEKHANNPAVADLLLDHDLNDKAWEAELISGFFLFDQALLSIRSHPKPFGFHR